jgi:hypothetical protein
MRPLLLILCLTTFTITARADDTPSATLSPDDAVAYIDVVVKKWIEVNRRARWLPMFSVLE